MPRTKEMSHEATYVPLSAGDHARLALVEALLDATGPGESARSVLYWLGQHSEVGQSLCAIVTDDGLRLEGIAGDGVSQAEVEAFTVDLEPSHHPLVAALASRESVCFRITRHGRARHPRTPLGPQQFHSVPLRRLDGDENLGLLLLAGLEAPPNADILWAADLLALRLTGFQFEAARRSHQRAHRQRTLLREMVDAVSDPILVTNSAGQILQTNMHAERLFAVTERESEGRHRAVSLNNMLFSAAAFTESARGHPVRREILLVDPSSGEDLLFELINTPVSLPDGGSGGVNVLRNVTDLREANREIEENYHRLQRAEAEARAERDRLDLILNSVVDPVVVTEPGGSIIHMNPPAERLFLIEGIGDSEIAERRIRTNHSVFSSLVSNVYAGQAIRSRGELSLCDPHTGAVLQAEAISGKVIDRHGAATAVVTVLHDRREAIEKARLYEQVKRHSEELEQKVQQATVDLVRQNEQLLRQKLALEEASRLKSQFLANISHELRTPLHAVLGYTDLLLNRSGPELTDPQREKLRRVDSNAEHLLTVINDLLDFARIEAGRIALEISRFRIAELIDEIFSELEVVISRSGLTVTRETPAGLPPIRSDRKKLKQIILNLLSNALKFTPAGFVRVEVQKVGDRDHLTVSVADTGIGIPPEGLKRIFEDFSQLDDAVSRKYGGTGLGLAISRRLAESLGGEITVVSTEGLGSTFTLRVPMKYVAKKEGH